MIGCSVVLYPQDPLSPRCGRHVTAVRAMFGKPPEPVCFRHTEMSDQGRAPTAQEQALTAQLEAFDAAIRAAEKGDPPPAAEPAPSPPPPASRPLHLDWTDATEVQRWLHDMTTAADDLGAVARDQTRRRRKRRLGPKEARRLYKEARGKLASLMAYAGAVTGDASPGDAPGRHGVVRARL